MNANLRKVVIIVAVLNLAYFGVEFAVARAIGSVSLFADSVDFLEDASVNFLIAMALGWNATNRARLGMALASILLIRFLGVMIVGFYLRLGLGAIWVVLCTDLFCRGILMYLRFLHGGWRHVQV